MSSALAGTIVLAIALLPIAASAGPGRANARGFSQVAGCVANQHELLVDFVVDESASLQTTDPHDDRVKGILTAIDSLHAFQTEDPAIHINVALSAFATGFDSIRGWSVLDDSTAASLRQVASRELPRRNQGHGTDYRQAMINGQKQLDARARQLHEPKACKLMLFFTDGGLDVDGATAQAQEQLCQPNGILDSVRRDGITVVALALFTPHSGITAQNRALLEALATGAGGGTRCGTVPIPPGGAQGIYLPATNAAELQRIFAEIGIVITGGQPHGTIHCPGIQCPNGTYRFAFDPGLTAIDLVVDSAGYESGQPLRLTTPDGHTVKLQDGSSHTIDGATVSMTGLGSFATVTLDFPQVSRSVTTWALSPPTPASIDTYSVWGAHLEARPSTVTAGRTNQVAFALVDAAGDPLATSLYRSSSLRVTANGRPISAQVQSDGTLLASLPVSVQRVPSSYSLTATLSARTSAHGYLVGPISVSAVDRVTLPPQFPTLSPGSLSFPRANGDSPESATLALRGSALGSTKICLGSSSVTVPGHRAASNLVSASSPCVTLGRGQSSTLTLTLMPGASEDGIATGSVNLTLTGATHGVSTVSVPVAMPMSRVVNQAERWLLIGVLVALAVLIPYILLVAANLVLSRFDIAATSRIYDLPVAVRPGGGFSPPTRADLVRYATPPSGVRARSVDLGSVGASMVGLKSRRLFGLGEPVSRASVPAGYGVVSGLQPYVTEVANQAPVKPGRVDASFVVLPPASGTSQSARLIMVVPSEVSADGIIERANAVATRPDWPHILERHAEGSARTEPDKGSRTTAPSQPQEDGPLLPDLDLPGAPSQGSAGTGEASAPSSIELPGSPIELPGSPGPSKGAGSSTPGSSESLRSRFSRGSKLPKPPKAPKAPKTYGSGGASAGDARQQPPPDDLPDLPDFLK